MRENLDTALSHVFQEEGGFAQRATEPGGSVNMGISQQTLAAWNHSHGLPVPTVQDVKDMSKDTATQIYVFWYASPVHFNDLPSGVDLAVLDCGVNMGVAGSLKILALGVGHSYPIGGHVDQATIVLQLVKTALSGGLKTSVLVDKICDLWLDDKRRRKEWKQFGKGWTSRIEQVRTHAKELTK